MAAARAMSVLRTLGQVLLFTVVWCVVGGLVGGAGALVVEPWTTEQVVLLSDLRLYAGDLHPSVTGCLAWTIAVHPAVAVAAFVAALATPRLGRWRLALAAVLVGEAFRYIWTFATGASHVIEEIPRDAIDLLLRARMVSAGQHLLGLSVLAAIPTAVVSAWLGCLLRPQPSGSAEAAASQSQERRVK